MKKALSLLLALMMAVGLVMPQTWATGLQETEPDAAITETPVSYTHLTLPTT